MFSRNHHCRRNSGRNLGCCAFALMCFSLPVFFFFTALVFFFKLWSYSSVFVNCQFKFKTIHGLYEKLSLRAHWNTVFFLFFFLSLFSLDKEVKLCFHEVLFFYICALFCCAKLLPCVLLANHVGRATFSETSGHIMIRIPHKSVIFLSELC